jgi:hypothetical protein
VDDRLPTHGGRPTAWFLESVVSAALIVLVVRTRRSVFRSPPSPVLAWVTLAAIAVTIAIPWSPLAAPMGFCPIPGRLMFWIGVIVALLVAAAEGAKWLFYPYLEPYGVSLTEIGMRFVRRDCNGRRTPAVELTAAVSVNESTPGKSCWQNGQIAGAQGVFGRPAILPRRCGLTAATRKLNRVEG